MDENICSDETFSFAAREHLLLRLRCSKCLRASQVRRLTDQFATVHVEDDCFRDVGDGLLVEDVVAELDADSPERCGVGALDHVEHALIWVAALQAARVRWGFEQLWAQGIDGEPP